MKYQIIVNNSSLLLNSRKRKEIYLKSRKRIITRITLYNLAGWRALLSLGYKIIHFFKWKKELGPSHIENFRILINNNHHRLIITMIKKNISLSLFGFFPSTFQEKSC